MGRKKKKPARDDGRNQLFPDSPGSQTAPPLSFIEVTLLKNSSSQGQKQSIVHVSLFDSDRLDLCKDEFVFVVGESGVALLPYRAKSLPSNYSGGSPQGMKERKSTLRPGMAEITPASMVSLVAGDSGVTINQEKLSETPNQLSTPANGYSFQHQVSTPSSATSTSASLSKDQITVTLIGCRSNVGKSLTRQLCRTCSRIVLACSDAIEPKNHTYLARLFLAHYVGQFVQNKQQITISFTGKHISLRVVEIDATLDLSGLDLEDGVGDDELPIPCQDVLQRCRGRLLEIKSNTEVEFGSNRGNEKEPMFVQKQFVAGLDQIVEQVTTLLKAPLYHSDWFLRQGLSVPRGVLLYGPSGVGKTALAQQVVASLAAPSEYVACSEILAQAAIVGQAERYLSRIFRPTDHKRVVILDDVHLICSRRGGHSATDRLAATLLSLMDGVVQTQVVVLAISTDPSLLDRALRRSGRLDTEIEVPIPDSSSKRAAILRFHGEKVADGDVEWENLGKLAKGFDGSDCFLATKAAARLAYVDRSDVVYQKHFEQAIRGTKPSAIKSIAVEIPKVPWSSIGGMDSVKQQLREAISMSEEELSALGISISQGVLLYGPPGCSKTLMARALATESSMNFLAVKGPELLSKWLGESERALASLFRRARMASPSIIFFDEIDAIASKRGSGDSSSSTRLLSQLLTELDGVKLTSQRVIVVAATNRPDLLDNALVRYGRIDRKIYVGLPDEASRAQILQLQFRGKPFSDDLDIQSLAKATEGCSGAEIVALCRDAALHAAEIEGPQKITKEHMSLALHNLQRQITPEMLDFYQAYRDGRLV